jgi:hypothetical protein
MTAAELREQIERLLARRIPPEKIATIDSARAFKRAAIEAQKAKSLAKLQSAFNNLRGFYGV